MPILKSGSKRRSRADLTVEMISAPLADFRHTMHIGRGGDTFGDTSFLSTKAAPANQVEASKNGSMMHRIRGSKHSLTEIAASDSACHPLQANSAVSLPHVNDDHDLGHRLPRSSLSSFSEVNGLDGRSLNMEREEQGFDEERRFSESPVPPNEGMSNAGSNLSLNIDLGPSMLGDILSVMDQNGRDQPTKGDAEWSLNVSHPLSSVASASQSTSLPNTTQRTTYNTTQHAMLNNTQSTAVPKTTQRATLNTTQSTAVSNTTHHATLLTQSTAVPKTTQRATLNTTQSTAVPNTTHRVTHNSTSDSKYSGVYKATPASTYSSVYDTTPTATHTRTTPNTTHGSSFSHDDFLFMDEDDEEIRV